LSGVVTVPPRAIVVPLTVIPELTKALLGILVKVLREPEIIEDSMVLFVIVCACVR
jgi:hypothetical protein